MENLSPPILIALLFGMALLLGIGEVLTPFFGFAIAAFGCLFLAVAFGFQTDTTTGWLTLGIALIGTWVFFLAYLKLLPHTKMGRTLMPLPPPSGTGEAIPHLALLESLAGATGTTASTLRPIGSVLFDGRRVDAFAENGLIEAGRKVRVLRVQGTHVVVRTIDNTPPTAATQSITNLEKTT